MTVSLHPSEPPKHVLNQSDWDVDDIVELVATDLCESVPRSTVHRTITAMLAKYYDARVKIYVPILVRRKATELLRRTPMEIEAKFKVPDPATYWRLQTTGQLGGYELSTQQVLDISDTYLDTSKRHIFSGGYSCRRRRSPAGIVMTLKSLDKADGAVHRRQEFELALASALPPARWPDCPARERVQQLSKQEPLVPLFELQQTRIVRMLQQDERLLAEFCLDKVSLISDGKEQFYHELEVELLPSVPDQALTAIVDCIQNEWHLQPEMMSKFERALALLDSMPGESITAHNGDQFK